MTYQLTYLNPFGLLLEAHSENIKVTDIESEFLKDLFEKNQLLVLRNFEMFHTTDDFSNYCQRWGEISLWPFGKVLDLIEHDNPQDHIFDHSYVPLHWDGMYRPQIPEYQIFRCLKAPELDQGGKTIFSNTISALHHASSSDKELWQTAIGTYHRQMEFYHSKTISPVITKHPYKNSSIIRYNELVNDNKGEFINRPNASFSGIEKDKLNEFHQSLTRALYDPKNCYAHQWQENDIVIADNFSLLHGREAFISKSPRHIQRVQVLSNPPFDNPSLESYQ
ncbi:TauD/TfdA family dioxygenase [Thiotrichales bacterium 19S3-7]|nr:TauD/TfdA family dioxygenase [Thiotrichales bacterium 19S3-7]MCF6801953.1 TauD/TfdA family dioxygenase [Thiotrichales bacterium 19S3-11]